MAPSKISLLLRGAPVSFRDRSQISDDERHRWKTQRAWLAFATELDRHPAFWSQIDQLHEAFARRPDDDRKPGTVDYDALPREQRTACREARLAQAVSRRPAKPTRDDTEAAPDEVLEEIAGRFGNGNRKRIIAELLFSVSEPSSRDAQRARLQLGRPHAPRRPAEKRVYYLRPDGVAALEDGARFAARRGLGLCLVGGCENPALGGFVRFRSVRNDYCQKHGEPRDDENLRKRQKKQEAWRERLIDRFFAHLT